MFWLSDVISLTYNNILREEKVEYKAAVQTSILKVNLTSTHVNVSALVL